MVPKLIVAFVSVVAMASSVQAALYGYAQQNTGSYTISGSVGTITANSLNSAAQTANPSGSDAHAGLFDALEAYVGPGGGKPPENQFTPKGLTTPDYSRGDALVTSGPLTTNNVAELYLTTGGNASATGQWGVAIPVTLSESQPIQVGFSYANDLALTHDGAFPGTVQASYTYNISIQNSGGVTVFTSSPTAVNRTLSLSAPDTLNQPGSGTVSVLSGVLSGGNYTINITGTETVFANAVPEPAIGCALLGIVGGVILRRRRTS